MPNNKLVTEPDRRYTVNTSAVRTRDVAKTLLQLVKERGVATTRGVVVQLDVTQKDVATHLGLSRIEATLALNTLKHAGALTFEGSTLLVREEALEGFLRED